MTTRRLARTDTKQPDFLGLLGLPAPPAPVVDKEHAALLVIRTKSAKSKGVLMAELAAARAAAVAPSRKRKVA